MYVTFLNELDQKLRKKKEKNSNSIVLNRTQVRIRRLKHTKANRLSATNR